MVLLIFIATELRNETALPTLQPVVVCSEKPTPRALCGKHWGVKLQSLSLQNITLANPPTCSYLFRETNTLSANTRNLSCSSERPCCWSNHLQFCGVWREKFPGVNFKTAQNQEGWTPVMEKYYEAKKPIDRKDGSKSNPVRSCDDELWLGSAKEINLHTAKWNPRSDV